MISFGNLPQRSGDWTYFKPFISSKTLKVQYEDDGFVYLIYGYDGPEVLTCSIWKSIVPPSVVNGGYSQAQNDTDKTDFETNYKPSANGGIQGASKTQLRTFVVEVALAGALNKDMISIFNPASSGKIVKLREAWATVPSSSGATVIIPFEIRHATAITTGTVVNEKSLDTGDANDAVSVVRQAPTGITDHAIPVWWTWVEQINTAQGSTNSHTEILSDSQSVSELRPLTLREGNGAYLRQIATNTSTFRMGFLFTEESP